MKEKVAALGTIKEITQQAVLVYFYYSVRHSNRRPSPYHTPPVNALNFLA